MPPRGPRPSERGAPVRRLIRLVLIAAAFVGGCHVQNRLAIDACVHRGGRWLAAAGALPGGVCTGLSAR